MIRRATPGVMALVALCAGAAAAATAREDTGLVATRVLVAQLRAAGRAETAITVTFRDPLGGPDRVRSGRLALEPPDRVRLDFPATGERLALRGDGGEWIQPAARQMVRIAREQAGVAAWLWEVFLGGDGTAFVERGTAARRYALEPRASEAGLPAGISIALDARGLPAELEFAESEDSVVRYRFERWRFGRARGAKAFTLAAPPGYEVVDLP